MAQQPKQTRKMSPPKKPTKRPRESLLELGGTPIRMTLMYLRNRAKRKQFEEDTVVYEKKKKAYDAAMKQLSAEKKGKEKTATTATKGIERTRDDLAKVRGRRAARRARTGGN